MKTCNNGAVERGIGMPLAKGAIGGVVGYAKDVRPRRAHEGRIAVQEVCAFTLESGCGAVPSEKGGGGICPYTLEPVNGPAPLRCRTAV